jgi:hypothetical protein
MKKKKNINSAGSSQLGRKITTCPQGSLLIMRQLSTIKLTIIIAVSGKHNPHVTTLQHKRDSQKVYAIPAISKEKVYGTSVLWKTPSKVNTA